MLRCFYAGAFRSCLFSRVILPGAIFCNNNKLQRVDYYSTTETVKRNKQNTSSKSQRTERRQFVIAPCMIYNFNFYNAVKRNTVQKCNATQEKIKIDYPKLKLADDCPACEKHGFLVLIADHKSEKDSNIPDISESSEHEFGEFLSSVNMKSFVDLNDKNVPGLKYLEFPKGVPLWREETGEMTSKKPFFLFIRTEYEPLFQILNKNRDFYSGKLSMADELKALKPEDRDVAVSSFSYTGGAVILGNPGIGKSRSFLYYCLVRFVMLKAVVLLEAQFENSFFILDFSGKENTKFLKRVIFNDARALIGLLKDPSMVYLVDPSSKNVILEPVGCGAYTLLFSSPDQKHYSQFVKNVLLEFYLPVWTLNELLAFRKFVLLDINEEDRAKVITERYNVVGGLIRHVFSYTGYQNGVKALERAIKQLDIKSGTILAYFLGSCLDIKVFKEATHFIFHAHIKYPFLQPSNVDFASFYAEKKVCELFAKLVKAKRDGFALMGSSIAAASCFEGLVNSRLAFGGSFEGGILFSMTTNVDLKLFDGKMFNFPNPKKDRFTFSELKETGKLVENTFYAAKIVNDKAIDALYYGEKEVYMFQTTLAKKHPVRADRMLEYLNFFHEKGCERVVLVFVLRSDKFAEFFKKQSYVMFEKDDCKKSTASKKSVLCRDPLLDKIIQCKLCIADLKFVFLLFILMSYTRLRTVVKYIAVPALQEQIVYCYHKM